MGNWRIRGTREARIEEGYWRLGQKLLLSSRPKLADKRRMRDVQWERMRAR